MSDNIEYFEGIIKRCLSQKTCNRSLNKEIDDATRAIRNIRMEEIIRHPQIPIFKRKIYGRIGNLYKVPHEVEYYIYDCDGGFHSEYKIEKQGINRENLFDFDLDETIDTNISKLQSKMSKKLVQINLDGDSKILFNVIMKCIRNAKYSAAFEVFENHLIPKIYEKNAHN